MSQATGNVPRRPRSIDLPQVGHKAPIPLGARVGNILCTSSLIGKDPADGSLPADGATQVAHVFTHMRALLAAGGASLQDVVRVGITLADDSLRDVINTHWLACFPDPADRPARHISVHPLAHGMALQLELMAVVAER